MKYARTVTGLVAQDALGVTLAHEHLNVDGRLLCTAKDSPVIPKESLNWPEVRLDPMRFAANIDGRDESLMMHEVAAFKRWGGGTIIDATPDMSASRDPHLLRRLAKGAGVNVVMGGGFYTAAFHDGTVSTMSVEELTELFVKDVTEGVGDSGIQAGMLGELGVSRPMHVDEEKVLRAAGRAHALTGVPISIHYPSGAEAALECLKILEESGVEDFSKVSHCHMEMGVSKALVLELARLGSYVQFDLFGQQGYTDSRGDQYPTDHDRIHTILELGDAGHLSRVLISHDVSMLCQWRHYGGGGLTHIFTDVLPEMRRLGMSAEDVEAIVEKNPARFISFLDG